MWIHRLLRDVRIHAAPVTFGMIFCIYVDKVRTVSTFGCARSSQNKIKIIKIIIKKKKKRFQRSSHAQALAILGGLPRAYAATVGLAARRLEQRAEPCTPRSECRRALRDSAS